MVGLLVGLVVGLINRIWFVACFAVVWMRICQRLQVELVVYSH